MDILDRVVFILLVVFNITLAAYGQDVCVKKGPCVCEFSNGTGIDLSPTAKSIFYSAPIFNKATDAKEVELSTYYFHPCYDVMPPPPMNRTSANDTCDKPLAICRQTVTLKLNDTLNMYTMDNGVYNYMGTGDNSTFSSAGESIIYKNVPSACGDVRETMEHILCECDILATKCMSLLGNAYPKPEEYRFLPLSGITALIDHFFKEQTIVLLHCAESEDRLIVSSIDEPNKIVLAFYSRSACLTKISDPDAGRSFGSTLLIIFFSCVVFYLVLGICTKKFLMGATGIEVIPNLGFWNDLPNLVKDGWAFTINGFRLPARGSGPVTSPDPNSYDSI